MEAGARRLYSSLWTGEERNVRIVVANAIVEVGDEPQLVQRQHDSVRREDRCKLEQMARSTHSMAEGATGGSCGDKSAQNFSIEFLVGVGRGRSPQAARERRRP